METFSALLTLCAGNSPHKGQLRGALMSFFICTWTNGWVNNRDAGDLRRQSAHYDVTVITHALWGCFTVAQWTNLPPSNYNKTQDSTNRVHKFYLAHVFTLRWRHNERDGVSNHRRIDSLLNRLFRRRPKKTSMFRVTGLYEENSPVTGEFLGQRASNAIAFWCVFTIFAKLCCDQLLDFSNKVEYKFLSAFRKDYVCETVLIKMIENWRNVYLNTSGPFY